MSDYTPTTTEVENAYAASVPGGFTRRVEARREFDRWLAQERAEAGAQALEQATDTGDPEFHIEVALGGSDYVRGWLRERAASLRAGER